MSREGKFLIHCIESYRLAKRMSGAAVALTIRMRLKTLTTKA